MFEQFGNWLRPAAYPLPAESLQAAAQREAGAVRRRAGMLDGSPLGKLEIFGPDAAQFFDLMYVGTMSNLSVGQARYGLLLNENGIVVDDGIVARLGPQHYWVNTTSAGVERTAAAFEEWLQCEYTTLKVLVTPVTSRWGNVTVAGPRAWDWLASAGFDQALSPSSMKHMTLRHSTLEGVPLRVLRASFSGELGYEINLPADHVGCTARPAVGAGGRILGGALRHRSTRNHAHRKRLHSHRHRHRRHDPAAGHRFRARPGSQGGEFRRPPLAAAAGGAQDPDRFQLVALSPLDRTHLAAGGRADRARCAADLDPKAT